MIVYERTYFGDLGGDALDNGKLFIGEAEKDPELYPVGCFWDADLTIPAAQPLPISGGYVIHNGVRAAVYTAAASYSMRVRAKNDVQIDYIAEVRAYAQSYLFTDLATANLPDDTQVIRTNGYRRLGWGSARYTLWKAPMANLPTFGEGKWWFKSNGGAKSWYLDPEGDAYFDMFGAYEDNLNDDFPAFQAMQDFCRWRGGYKPGDQYCAGGVVRKRGLSFSSQSWQLKCTITLIGTATGQSGASDASPKCGVRFDGTTGIFGNRFNTLGLGPAEASPTGGADGSLITGLVIDGTSPFASTENCHGIQGLCRMSVINCTVANFTGDGIRFRSNEGPGGNCNGWYVCNTRILRCGLSGLHTQGGDANAGRGDNVDIVQCGDWGIEEAGFLGNTYTGCQIDACGHIGAPRRTAPALAYDEGIIYAVAYGQGGLASTTRPGTNSSVWIPLGAGSPNAQQPQWAAGTTYRPGGLGCAIGNVNGTRFTGLYGEVGYPPFQSLSKSVFDGGEIGSSLVGTYTSAAFGALSSNGGFIALQNYPGEGRRTSSFAVDAYLPDTILTDQHPAYSPLTWAMKYENPSGDILFAYNGTGVYRLTGPTTVQTFGRDTPQPNQFAVPWLGLGIGSEARLQTYGSAPPTTGYHAYGEIVYNNGMVPANNAIDYWKCTAPGTPGTWAAR